MFHHHCDHFAGYSFVECRFADNSSLHVYLKLFSSLLPSNTRQPGPVAVLLGQMLKFSLIFSPVSHSLGVNRQTSSGCFLKSLAHTYILLSHTYIFTLAHTYILLSHTYIFTLTHTYILLSHTDIFTLKHTYVLLLHTYNLLSHTDILTLTHTYILFAQTYIFTLPHIHSTFTHI